MTAVAAKEFIITTSVAGTSRTQLWDSKAPLPLGHPFRWIMEKTDRGVRLRSLVASEADQHREVPLSEIQSGKAELRLKSFAVQIRQAGTVPSIAGVRSGNELIAYLSAGQWVLESFKCFENGKGAFIGKIGNAEIFSLAKTGTQVSLQSRVDGLKIARKPLPKGETLQLDSGALAPLQIQFQSYTFRFSQVESPNFVDSQPATAIEENAWFHKSLRYAAIALGSFLVLSWVWPKPQVDNTELIPPQFAKLVMTTPAKSTSGGASTEKLPAAALNAPKKVQETAVVQAFRAKALQNAVSGLLKGGMTKLLAQSDFVMGNPSDHDARRIFDTQSSALKATAPDTGLMNARNVKIGSIGGVGIPSSSGGRVIGYGKGEHANVKGQGEGFVSMDIGGAAVEEGLTKDEVGEVIHRHLSEVRYCYESAMLRSPDIEGKLIVNFTIGGAGMVKSSEVKSSTLPDPRMDDCILRRLATWKFPNTKGGIDVAVSYPFIFKTLGR